MPRHLFRKYLPSHQSVREHRLFSRFGWLLDHHRLWSLNRHTVAGGVAVGLFAGLVPGPLQMLSAALLAVPLRVNLPIALATTLYTNPFTIGPLYLLAYQLGRLVLPGEAQVIPAPDLQWSHLGTWLEAFVQWMLGMGKPLALGLVLLAVGLAVTGYFAVNIAWRIYARLAWRRRCRLRMNRPRPSGN